MKYIIPFLLVLLTACATTKPPAGPSRRVMPRADKIILTVSQSPDQAYKSFAGYLSSNDFTFTNSDEVIRVLKTDYKDYKGGSTLRYRINANIRSDSATVIQISGQGLMSILGHTDIENRGGRGSVAKKLWQTMRELAANYPHKAMYYARN